MPLKFCEGSGSYRKPCLTIFDYTELNYQRSGQPEFSGELSQEWEQITSVLLKKVNVTHEC